MTNMEFTKEEDFKRALMMEEEEVKKMCDEILKVKPDIVIHTASPNGNDNVSARPLFQRVNVEGTKAVIEVCRRANVKGLVYTSSASIISDNTTDLINADERWPVLRGKSQPDYYSQTKV